MTKEPIRFVVFHECVAGVLGFWTGVFALGASPLLLPCANSTLPVIDVYVISSYRYSANGRSCKRIRDGLVDSN